MPGFDEPKIRGTEDPRNRRSEEPKIRGTEELLQ
jgi:hypothetical protein